MYCAARLRPKCMLSSIHKKCEKREVVELVVDEMKRDNTSLGRRDVGTELSSMTSAEQREGKAVHSSSITIQALSVTSLPQSLLIRHALVHLAF